MMVIPEEGSEQRVSDEFFFFLDVGSGRLLHCSKNYLEVRGDEIF
jgi:hypothetical protein